MNLGRGTGTTNTPQVNLSLLMGLGLVMVVALALFTLWGQQRAAPYAMGLLGVLAVIGILGIFASALGVIRFSAVARNEVLVSAIIETQTEACLVCDQDGSILYANQAYMHMSGTDDLDQLRGIVRVFSCEPEAADAIFRLTQAVRQKQSGFEEIRLKNAINAQQAGPAWYRVRVRPLKSVESVSAKQELFVWQVSDITHERRDQETSFQELQRIIDFLDHAPCGFFSVDIAGNFVYVNATLADWLGIDLARFQPKQLHFRDYVNGEAGIALENLHGEDGEIITEHYNLDLKDSRGTILPVELIHRVPFGHDNKAGDSLSLVMQRTVAQGTEGALQLSELRFERFFNNSPVAIAVLNSEGVIRRGNTAFLRSFSGANSIGVNFPLTLLVNEVERDKVSDAFQLVLSGQGSGTPLEVSLNSDDGLRSATLYFSQMTDEDNPEEAVVVYVVETTQQRALELQFAQSQKMQAVGQLAGGVAHDFNNVLTAIIGFSDLLLASHRPTDPAFQDIMNIKQNANRAAGLVRQLLAFSRRQTMRPKELYLSDVLADLSNLLGRLVGEKVELKVIHGRDLWPAMADANQLEQVIMNLVVNARDAMTDGGVVTIRTQNVAAGDTRFFEGAKGSVEEAPSGDYVLIEVADDGHGMSPEILEKIFEPFFSTKEVGKGTGLGLSTVYGIVKQTGGYVFCESAEGSGTTFRVFLPRFIREEKEEDKTPVAEKQELADLTGSAKILLVEDEEAVRAFAARALSSRGYEVFEAATGAEALEVMEECEGAIDLVVSDVVMPEMDGPSLLVELRKKRTDLKIIFVSGYAEEAFEKNLPEGEKFTFLPKPFTLKQLAMTVKDVLES